MTCYPFYSGYISSFIQDSFSCIFILLNTNPLTHTFPNLCRLRLEQLERERQEEMERLDREATEAALAQMQELDDVLMVGVFCWSYLVNV